MDCTVLKCVVLTSCNNMQPEADSYDEVDSEDNVEGECSVVSTYNILSQWHSVEVCKFVLLCFANFCKQLMNCCQKGVSKLVKLKYYASENLEFNDLFTKCSASHIELLKCDNFILLLTSLK